MSKRREPIHIGDTEFSVTTKPGESPLCSICRQVLELVSESQDVTCDIRIERRAQDGCYLCKFFDSKLRNSHYISLRPISSQEKPKFKVRYRVYRLHEMELGINQINEDETGDDLNHCFSCSTSVATVYYDDYTSNRLTMPEANMFEHTKKIANVWLRRCRLQHQLCQVVETTFLPTRLIDVSLRTPPTPSLCLGENITSLAQYATLSHCWGDPTSMSMKLRLGTLESMMEVIDFSLLPKTFQHAIKVTQSLGIRYIWIDSLCIIQDSVDDWENESAAMAHVFSNSVINICATAGTDSTQGLFYNRAAIETRPVHVQLSLEGKPAQRATFCERAIWIDAVDEAPLNRRGWVLQERLLSRRNLCFGIEQLFWECCETTACETFPDTVPKTLLGFGNELGLKPSFAKLINDTAVPKRSLSDLCRFWEKLVQYYTGCRLTHPNDKLVAFGGLVSRVQGLFGSQYLAGMWQDHIVYQLSWRAKPPLSTDQQETESEPCYIAPSWSWAACSHPVENIFLEWNEDEVELMVDILDVHVDLVSANPYGQVKDGYLMLRACPAKVELRGEELWLHHGLNDIVSLEPESDELFWDNPEAIFKFSHGFVLYLLPILVCEPNKKSVTDGKWDWIMNGIIVVSIAGASALKFRRVGTFRFWGSRKFKMIKAACDHFDQTFKDCGLDLEVSKSTRGMTRYTITII